MDAFLQLSHTDWVLLGLLIAATYGMVGLVAIWAALARRHWFLRFAVVAGVLALAVPIRAYDLLLSLLTQVVIVIGTLTMIRVRRARRQPGPDEGPSGRPSSTSFRSQFSLGGLMLFTVVVAVAAAAASGAPGETWAQWPCWAYFGIAFGISTLAASTGASRRCYWLGLGIVWGLALLAVLTGVLGRYGFWGWLFVVALAPSSALIALWLLVAQAAGYTKRMKLPWDLASGRLASPA